MKLISLRQLLDQAADSGYGVPAFNISNMEQGIAIMNSAKKCDSPVILQASRNVRNRYAGDQMIMLAAFRKKDFLLLQIYLQQKDCKSYYTIFPS